MRIVIKPEQQTLDLDSWAPGRRPIRARTGDPASSHAAADRMEKSGAMGEQMRAVLRLVLEYPGLTSKMLAEASNGALDRYQIARRLPDLEARGVVRKVDQGAGQQVRWFPRVEHLDLSSWGEK